MKIKTIAGSCGALALLCVGCNQDASVSVTASPPQAAPGAAMPRIEDMRLALTTGLSQNQSCIPLGVGLYYFKANQDDGLEAVASYIHEHTNLVSVAVFSAYENFASTWYSKECTLNLQYFPQNLNISNGVFAVFRDRR